MSPRGNTTGVTAALSALSLCERGKWAEALDAAVSIDSEDEAGLVRGCALVLTRPEEAKDVLSRAIRLLPAGELRERARLWLASSYWAAGELQEARAVLESVELVADDIRFLVTLNSSIFESKVSRALATLETIGPLLDTVSDLYQAKFYLQRGYLRRRLGDSDAAIIDYEAARILFEQADAPRYVAAATNNQAGLLVDTKRFADAHAATDHAIRFLDDDPLYLAQVCDQKALIFIAEHKYEQAEALASRSVDLLTGSDNRSILADSLITHARALKHLGRYVDALVQLEAARGHAAHLNSKTLLLAIAKQEKESAQALTQNVHVEMVETALDLSGGKLREAARLVGVRVQPLDRFIKLHNIQCHRTVRKSVITKPHNRLASGPKKPNKTQKN